MEEESGATAGREGGKEGRRGGGKEGREGGGVNNGGALSTYLHDLRIAYTGL